MMVAFRLLRNLFFFLLLLGAACALLPLRSLSSHLAAGSIGNGGGGDVEDCDNAGVYRPDNPFTAWPIAGGDWSHVTAGFCDPYYLQTFGTPHWGIDLGYATGTPVVAAATATVTRAEHDHPARGHNVAICSGGWCARYLHLNTIAVTVGEGVATGQALGTVGSTGNSTGPHLHFEVHDPSGTPVDPAPSLP